MYLNEHMDKRQMRITWNEFNWEKPSGHFWTKENQEKSNVAYENQYGFGHEEWLFNPRYRVNGFQYGYVRGVEKASLYLHLNAQCRKVV